MIVQKDLKSKGWTALDPRPNEWERGRQVTSGTLTGEVESNRVIGRGKVPLCMLYTSGEPDGIEVTG